VFLGLPPYTAIMKSPITCHVLDSSTGKPAQGVAIHLEQLESDIFHSVAEGITNSDGRCLDLLPSRGSEEATRKNSDPVAGQTYKIVFKTKEYFEHTKRKSFYPWVEITFIIEHEDHYHIPLLISPYAFTTYRGS